MYIEQIDNFKQISRIELSPEELLKMYYHFKDKYSEQYIISEEYENGKAITFCDVDYIEMKSYKRQSEAFKKYIKKTCDIESDLPRQKKITRTSPIKRKTIIVLASIVVALSAGIATNSILNADAYQPLTIEQLKNMEVDTGLQFDFEPSNIVEDIDICFVRRRQRLPEMKQEEAQAHAHQWDHCHHDRPPEGIQENSVVPRYNPMGHFTYLLQILMAKL